MVSICICPLENSDINSSPSTNHIVGTLDLALCIATENAKRSDPYTITWGFCAFCPKQGCIITSKRKIIRGICFIFENTEILSSFFCLIKKTKQKNQDRVRFCYFYFRIALSPP